MVTKALQSFPVEHGLEEIKQMLILSCEAEMLSQISQRMTFAKTLLSIAEQNAIRFDGSVIHVLGAVTHVAFKTRRPRFRNR